MHVLSFGQKRITEYFHLGLMCIILYYVSKQNYVLLDATAEIVTVVFAVILMSIVFVTVKKCENKYFHMLAIIISIFGLIALLVDDYDENFSLSILIQYFECIVINLSSVYISKNSKWHKLFVENKISASIFVLSVFVYFGFIAKFGLEYNPILFSTISGFLFAISFIIFLIRILNSSPNILKNNKLNFKAVVFFKILACLSFTLYKDDLGILNVLGHVFMNVSYYYILNLIIKEILINPYDNLFSKLRNKAEELEIINKKLDTANNKVESIEKLNSKFINLIPDGILIIRNKKIESINYRLLNMFGVKDKVELEELDFNKIIDSFHLDVFEERINSMDSSILEKPQEYEITWGNVKKWVEAISLIASDEKGDYIISAIRNIEDRKKAEEAEKLLELKNKEEEIKNDFFANISHELRTPINVIYSAIQVENECLKNNNCNESILKYNKIIKQNCLRLMRLINNIIDITRIESSFFKPNYKIENIISVVEEITMSIVEYVKSKNIELVFDTEIEEAYVNCDLDLIERIMLNLLSNAVKYGKDGGNIYVQIYKHSQDSVLISVKDDGIGIPEDMKKNIFDRFLKVDNSLSRKTEGSGIGLSLVKQLIELHQGTITCDSKLGGGSEFKIIFPTVEYSLANFSSTEHQDNYSKNAIQSVEIEFSDIYD